jgi:hypothetical protein
MVAIRAGGDKFRQQFPIARVCYLIEKDLSTLDAALDSLHGEDPLAAERRAYRRYCLGDDLGPRAAARFLQVAGEIVTGRPGVVADPGAAPVTPGAPPGRLGG